MQSIILHIDMNSYFASVEQQDHPEWRGKPLGVCEHLGGILIAASVEAKRWGISTGTPVWEARKLYPKIIVTKTHPSQYRLYSNRLMKILADYTDDVEQYSIDEAFIDVTKVCNVKISNFKFQITKPVASLSNHKFQNSNFNNQTLWVDPFEEAVGIAVQIKRRMKTEVGDWLTCSIGIAENKLLAKIASDLQKPDGMVVVNDKLQITNFKGECPGDCRVTPPVRRPVRHSFSDGGSLGEVGWRDRYGGRAVARPYSADCLIVTKDDLYDKLSLTDIPGIGKRQEKRLNELGIKTLKDLRDYPKTKLVAHFGIMGHHLHEMGNFRSSWKPKVDQEDSIKSIGHMYTLPKEYREKKFFIPVLYKLCEMVARRLRVQGLAGNVLHFHIHDRDHECFGKSKRLGYFLQDGREIFFESMNIFESVGVDVIRPNQFKLIGVTVSGLAEESGQQSLFERDERTKRAVKALDVINEKYGDFTVCRVPVKLAGNVFSDSIGFGRIKEHVRLAGFR